MKKIAEEHSLSFRQSKRIVNSIFDNIMDHVSSGNSVRFKGFGSFERVYRKERKARDIKSQKMILLSARNAIRFRPSKSFKDVVNKENKEMNDKNT